MPEPVSSAPAGELAFLAHKHGDDVAVAVRDVEPGDAVGACLDSPGRFAVTVREAIPLGRKVALRDLTEEARVVESGSLIGLALRAIPAGTLVRTHDVRSERPVPPPV